MAGRDELLIAFRPKTGMVTREEYDLCMRQFDSMPNLVKILAKAGKLAPWVVQDLGDMQDKDEDSS